MKNSDEKPKKDFPKDWQPISRVPKENLRDCGDVKLEFIGKLIPELLTEITKNNDVKIIKLISDDYNFLP